MYGAAQIELGAGGTPRVEAVHVALLADDTAIGDMHALRMTAAFCYVAECPATRGPSPSVAEAVTSIVVLGA